MPNRALNSLILSFKIWWLLVWNHYKQLSAQRSSDEVEFRYSKFTVYPYEILYFTEFFYQWRIELTRFWVGYCIEEVIRRRKYLGLSNSTWYFVFLFRIIANDYCDAPVQKWPYYHSADKNILSLRGQLPSIDMQVLLFSAVKYYLLKWSLHVCYGPQRVPCPTHIKTLVVEGVAKRDT